MTDDSQVDHLARIEAVFEDSRRTVSLLKVVSRHVQAVGDELPRLAIPKVEALNGSGMPRASEELEAAKKWTRDSRPIMADEVVPHRVSDSLDPQVETDYQVEDTQERPADRINERNDLL